MHGSCVRNAQIFHDVLPFKCRFPVCKNDQRLRRKKNECQSKKKRAFAGLALVRFYQPDIGLGADRADRGQGALIGDKRINLAQMRDPDGGGALELG